MHQRRLKARFLVKQQRKEKAGKWDMPLPKVRLVAEDEMYKVIFVITIRGFFCCGLKNDFSILKYGETSNEHFQVTDCNCYEDLRRKKLCLLNNFKMAANKEVYLQRVVKDYEIVNVRERRRDSVFIIKRDVLVAYKETRRDRKLVITESETPVT